MTAVETAGLEGGGGVWGLAHSLYVIDSDPGFSSHGLCDTVRYLATNGLGYRGAPVCNLVGYCPSHPN